MGVPGLGRGKQASRAGGRASRAGGQAGGQASKQGGRAGRHASKQAGEQGWLGWVGSGWHGAEQRLARGHHASTLLIEADLVLS